MQSHSRCNMRTASVATCLKLRMLRYEFRRKAELCCAGLSTAAAFRPSSCLSNLSQIRRLSMGAAGSVRGFVICQCDSSAPRKLLHGTLTLQPFICWMLSMPLAHPHNAGLQTSLIARDDQAPVYPHGSCSTSMMHLTSLKSDTNMHAWLSLGAGVRVAGSAPALQGFKGAREDALRHVGRLLRCAT